MDKSEILKEIKMPHAELLDYLLNKYGPAKSDYFATPECRSKSKKISRTSEGLYCHHMDEDKGGNLSKSASAIMQPFEWQKKERLVYCNALEHLILHMKIAVLRHNEELKKPTDIDSFFTTHGINMICTDINDMFINEGTSIKWRKRCYEEFRDNYTDYVQMIKGLMLYIEKAYTGEKEKDAFLKIGSCVHYADGDAEIIKISKRKDKILLHCENGKDLSCYTYVAAHQQLTYKDCVDIQFRDMASGYESFYNQIYDDFINFPVNDEVEAYATALTIDFSEEEFAWGSRFFLK